METAQFVRSIGTILVVVTPQSVRDAGAIVAAILVITAVYKRRTDAINGN